jgi:hypothetical protein
MIAVWIAANVAAASLLASARRALRRLPPAGVRLWLVRPGPADVAGTLALVLLDRLPGLLVALASKVGRYV